jgi:cytochrome b561/polyisoprenoid-binding protein YceI
MRANTQTSYGSVARGLHWAVALLLITTFVLGFVGQRIARNADTVDMLQVLYSIHKTIGITVLVLALIRVVWAIMQPKPQSLHPERKAETLAAEAVHWALYLALFIMPLSGWVSHASEVGFAPILWPFGQGLPFVPTSETVAHAAGAVHWASSYVLLGTLALHVAGAIKHVALDRDETLARMTRGVSAGASDAQVSHSVAFKCTPPVLAVCVWAGALLVGLALSGVFTSEHREQAENADHEVVVTAGAFASGAPVWVVEDGSLSISVAQMGADVSGQFANWSAHISYDEGSGAGHVDVVIDAASLTLGSVTEQALGPEFFNVDNFATAGFAGKIVRQEDGSHSVQGAVTLLGKTAPVDLPFELAIEGNTAIVSGSVQLDRRDYDMGAGYEGEGTVGYMVGVDITLTATRSN